MRATLISKSDDRHYNIPAKGAKIGSEGCDINIQSPYIEKTHAIVNFDQQEQAFVISDLNTAHGVYVNESRVQNSAVKLANNDLVRIGFNGPLFEVKIYDTLTYPPVQVRAHQAWNTSSTYPAYNQSTQESSYLPYLPVSHVTTSQSFTDSNVTATNLPYPPQMPPGQIYLDPKIMNSDITPHPPVRSRPLGGTTTQRARPLSAGGLSSSGRWLSNKCMEDLTAEEKVQEMEQKLLKMGDEISRLASYEAECFRKDGVIVSLRNEMADLRTLLNEKEDLILKHDLDRTYRTETVYSQHDTDLLERVMREKEDFEKQSARKMALLQGQIHQKDTDIRDLENKLKEVRSAKWPKGDPEVATNTIASLKSVIAKKDLQIAHLQTDLEKCNKQRNQSASLINSLQREVSTKDASIQKSRTEIDRLRRDARDKESQIASLSARLTKQKASKEAEKDFRKKEEEVSSFRQKLLTADLQIKEKLSLIRDMENEIGILKRTVNEYKQNEIAIQKELQNMRIQYVEKERADKSNRIELKETQIKVDKFKNSLLRILYSSGVIKQAKELQDEEIISYVDDLNNERANLQLKADEFHGFERERRHYAKEDDHCKQAMEKFFASMEKRLIRSGRLCEVLDDEIGNVHGFEATDNLTWIKDIITNILQQERNWEESIEDALRDAGMEADRGKREPALLIRKMNERIKKKKEKIANLKTRLKAVEIEHEESLTNFKKSFLKDTELEVTKAVEKLKSEEEKRVQRLKQEFIKREKEKVEEAVEAERVIFEREFGNLTELHKQLGQSQVAIDQHKNKSTTLQDQILQLKFSMEKAQQNEKELRKEIEQLDVNHKAQLESMNKDKEELKEKFMDEVNIYREQAHQYSLTIVALEDRLLKLNRSKKKKDDDSLFAKQSKDFFSASGRVSPPRSPRKMVSRPTSPRKIQKHDVSILTELSLLEEDRRTQDEISRLTQLVGTLRKDAADARQEADDQNDVVRGLKRDLAGASARLSDLTGELDDSQKEKIEELLSKICKQDEELFTQRKQLIELSKLVEKQEEELLRRDDKLKEQMYVSKVQEKKLEERGKEIVHMIKTQETMKEEEEMEKTENEKQAYMSKEITAAGARCLGDRHDQTIARQKEALAEMRLKIKDLEVFKPPFPSQQAALKQVSLMKRELTELRTELSLRGQDMHKDESELQAETRLSRELLNSANQELAVEKMAHGETREQLDASEQTYLDLMRAVCSLLEMDVPKRFGTITNMPQKEREKIIIERQKIMDDIIQKLDALHKRLIRKEKLLGGYERDLGQLRDTEDLAGRKSAEAISLSNSLRSKQNEIDCLREALRRSREDLDEQRRLNKSFSQKKIFKMDFDKQYEKEGKAHDCYQDEEKRYKEEMKKRKQTEKLKRKSYEIESLKKELRSADLELSETAAKLYEFQTQSESRSSPRKLPDEEIENEAEKETETEPALAELWKHT